MDLQVLILNLLNYHNIFIETLFEKKKVIQITTSSIQENNTMPKETILADELTESVKDILFDWSKEYDSFEDMWNLIYHLKVK